MFHEYDGQAACRAAASQYLRPGIEWHTYKQGHCRKRWVQKSKEKNILRRQMQLVVPTAGSHLVWPTALPGPKSTSVHLCACSEQTKRVLKSQVLRNAETSACGGAPFGSETHSWTRAALKGSNHAVMSGLQGALGERAGG
eukprot:scaffold2614_cov19-Tisochrysis_lutea.AAC.1